MGNIKKNTATLRKCWEVEVKYVLFLLMFLQISEIPQQPIIEEQILAVEKNH